MRDTKKPHYYEILQLQPDATDREIKARYRLLSKRYHPDMGGSQAAMAGLNEAYAVLSDPFRRSLYDTERRRSVNVPPRTPERPVYAAPWRQPAPRAESPFAKQSSVKHRTSWWGRLVWTFAVFVVAIGLVSQLPLAQAAPDDTTATASSPTSNNQTDPAFNNSATVAPRTANTSPAVSTSPAEPEASTQPTPCGNADTNQSQTTAGCTDSMCAGSSCQQTQPRRGCTLPSPYKRLVCNYEASTCTNGTRHSAACY